jgi:hypothetical protein
MLRWLRETLASFLAFYLLWRVADSVVAWATTVWGR